MRLILLLAGIAGAATPASPQQQQAPAKPFHALNTSGPKAERRAFETVCQYADMLHSTVTLFARLRG